MLYLDFAAILCLAVSALPFHAGARWSLLVTLGGYNIPIPAQGFTGRWAE